METGTKVSDNDGAVSSFVYSEARAQDDEPKPVRISTLRPLDDQVVLLRVKNDRSEGGIIIPDQALDRASTFWRVLAVGPGRLFQGSLTTYEDSDGNKTPRIPPAVKVGDLVAMIPAAHLKGGEIDLTDDNGVRQRVLVIHEDAIVAVVT